ncbi:PucR family transcriptional regulator [Tomitella biformata]|uniref:PucR family transcriptional regulator n=1 Tax=Tomitella biformata TaxID=630403 RepID=UPI00056F4C79|nr:PucR family transcriptional regulator [Tomitella biformata]
MHPTTVQDLLATSFLSSCSVLAGHANLGREIMRLNVMEVPDVITWLRPQDLLLTTGFMLDQLAEPVGTFFSRANSRGIAAVIVHLASERDDSLPQDALAVAGALGLPVIAVTQAPDPGHPLGRGLAALAASQRAAMFRAERLRRRLVDVVVAGGAFADIATAGAQELSAAILVTTSDGREIARAGSADDLCALAHSHALDATGRLRTDAIEGGLGVRSTECGSIAVSAISANGVDHGRIAAFRRDRTLAHDDLYLLERAASVCALVVSRDQALASVEDKHRSNFVRDLLLGRGGGHDHAVAHAKSFGWDLDREVVVVSIEPDPVPLETPAAPVQMPLVDRQARAFSSALASRDPAAAMAALATETVILLGADAHTMDTVHELVAIVRGEGGGGRRAFSVGVSRPCTSMDELPTVYSQARTALQLGRKISGDWAVTHFDDLGVYRLLSLVDDEGELESFARETLRELTADTAEAQDMRRTLETLLSTNINIAETARKLHFHYNTLRYRVVKLEKILGSFTDQPELCLDLSLALKIMSMRRINH